MCDVLGVNPLKKGTVPFLVDVDVWRGAAERDMGFRRARDASPTQSTRKKEITMTKSHHAHRRWH